MNLVDTSNTDMSLIQTILTNPSIVGLIVYLTLLAIVGVIVSMRHIEINRKIETAIGVMTLIVLFTAMVTMPFGFIKNNPKYTYQGNAKVLHVEPKDEDGKQDITLKHGKDLRKLSVYSDDEIENLQKGNHVRVKTTYDRTLNLFNIGKPFYINDNDEPRKHIPFKDMMFHEEDVEVIKK